jgi:hypothetical protein
MIILIVILTAALAIFVALSIAINIRFSFFEKQKVIGPKPKFPYGNTKDGYEGKCNMVYDIDKIYR